MPSLAIGAVICIHIREHAQRGQHSFCIDMTTAARPTFEPARGGQAKGEGGLSDLSALSKHYSSRDLPGQLKLKTR